MALESEHVTDWQADNQRIHQITNSIIAWKVIADRARALIRQGHLSAGDDNTLALLADLKAAVKALDQIGQEG